MKIKVDVVPDLGLALRAVRRSSHVRLDDLAAMAGVSKQFVSDVEHGKPTVQLGLVLKLLAELGVFLTLDIPQEAGQELAALQRKGGLKPLNKRRTAAAAPESSGTHVTHDAGRPPNIANED
ncbi:MAG: transcriptional regulator [Polaromonas sp.]|jgi:transcriptional regulator with XRE-family HTH domain|nr:transcriptional regulator [Polaromonas sp.]